MVGWIGGHLGLGAYRERQFYKLFPSEDGVALRLVHSEVPGRIRLKLHGFSHFPELTPYLEKSIGSRWIVQKFRICQPTGSLTIVFNADIPPKKVIKTIESAVYEAIKWIDQGVGVHELTRYVQKNNFYSLSQEDLSKKLAADLKQGLSPLEAKKRLLEYGANEIRPKPPRSSMRIALDQISTLPMILLIGSAGISLLTGGVADAAAMLGVLVLNGSIGYVTESGIERTIQSLSHRDWDVVICKRAGHKIQIPVEQLVPGDLVYLARGQIVPADMRLIKAHHLTINESMLTGESEPVEKNDQRLTLKNLPITDQKNMAFRGTAITGGAGKGIVVATGSETEIGRIQTMIDEAVRVTTPMEKHLQDVTRTSVMLSLNLSILYGLLACLRGQDVRSTAQMAASMAIAAMPEGLPTILTTSLARGIHNLKKQNVLIRSLAALESLANIDHLCLDKTGTITLDQMDVVRFAIGEKTMGLENDNSDIRKLLSICVLNSEIQFEKEQKNQLAWKGSSTEKALWSAAIAMRIDPEKLYAQYPRHKIKYRSERRNLVKTYHNDSNGETLVTCKGRPKEVLDLCHFYQRDGNVKPLTEDIKTLILDKNREMSSGSLRVLGVAAKGVFEEQSKDWIWLGLVGMRDRIKSEVQGCLLDIANAGVRASMVTGDQTQTACAIGQQIGLNNGSQVKTLSQDQFESLGGEDMRQALSKAHVFSRFNPSQKLALVQALQKQGDIVGMTGDGVNDGPALKAAHVGIAMGKQGSEVAREIADVILLEDDLSGILEGIKEGRTIHENVKKAVHFILATNASELTPPFFALLAGAPPPMNALQYLWINLVTDILPEVALALEPSSAEILNHHPNEFGRHLIEKESVKKIFGQAGLLSLAVAGGYFSGLARHGPGLKTNTLAFLSLTGSQLVLVYRLQNRSASGSHLVANLSIAGAALMMTVPIVLPPFRRMLNLGRPNAMDLVAAGILSCLPSAVMNYQQTQGEKICLKKQEIS